MISNEKIESYVTDELELSFTDNINNSLYLLTNGKMVSGVDEYGERTEDHRCLIDLVLNGQNYYALNDQTQAWIKLHKETGLVRICPESQEALIATSQQLTEKQQQILKDNQYKIEKYC